MMYQTKIGFTLKPHFCKAWPKISVGLDDFILFKTRLQDTKTYSIDHPLEIGDHELWVKFMDKANENSTLEADQAVEIVAVTIEGMSTDRFIWNGVYTPEYPEPWASQQGELPKELTNISYLGHNGVWRLKFTVPIFTWIHKTEHLGWLYD